jgi:hypothetical protein
MKAIVLAMLSFLAVSLTAQTPENVAITEEVHNKLVLDNPYVRIFHVSVPINEGTLSHRHDHPYVTVSLGDNDFINAVVGKPETHVAQKDRQIGYSDGGFVHTVRPANGDPFNNVTVELLRPQGMARNRCEKIVDGPLDDCKSGPDSPLKALLKLVNVKPAFVTDDILVATVSLASGVNYSAFAAHSPQLFIACDHSEFKTEMPGETSNVLHGGEILWVPAGGSAKITGATAEGTAAVVIITFKAADKNVK